MKPSQILVVFVAALLGSALGGGMVWMLLREKAPGNPPSPTAIREEPNKKPKPAPAAKEKPTIPPPSSPPETGTLVIKTRNYAYESPHYRIYLDGKIAGGGNAQPASGFSWETIDGPIITLKHTPAPQETDIPLEQKPGNYLVEVVVGNWLEKPAEIARALEYPIDWFAFSFPVRKHVTVEAGKRTVLQIDITPKAYRSQNDRVEAKAPGTPEDFFQLVANRRGQYVQDAQPLHNAASRALEGTACVLLDFPEKYGGRREYDAEQLRWILHWLDCKYPHPELTFPLLPAPIDLLKTAAEQEQINQAWFKRTQPYHDARNAFLNRLMEDRHRFAGMASELANHRKE